MAAYSRVKLLIDRTKLLDAARGILDGKSSLGFIRCFPLLSEQVQRSPPTPMAFHATLCSLIRNAKQRVTLASLYVGPAADAIYEKEAELLDALRAASSKKISIKVLLDQHRALRPVPVKDSRIKTITSAEACKDALIDSGSVHLISVLPSVLKHWLPNPYNEIAGVFHIKAYIIDNNLIISGANLSEEYFIDRIDRYFWVTCPELVQCYQDIIDALCLHGHEYNKDDETWTDRSMLETINSKRKLLQSLRRILTTTEPKVYDIDKSHGPGDPIAYALPTFHAPPAFIRGMKNFRSDHQVLQALIKEITKQQQKGQSQISCHLATAYLNPTDSFIKLLAPLHKIVLLTAGRVSHGFKPKAKAGNKGKDWIPTVFEHAAQLVSKKLKNAIVAYYQRPEWSFHAKGIWLAHDSSADGIHKDSILLSKDAQIYAVTHGSSNYGQRSAYRDMESNLFLILPEKSPLAKEHVDEWNALCDYANASEDEGTRPVQLQIRGAFPVIRYFF